MEVAPRERSPPVESSHAPHGGFHPSVPPQPPSEIVTLFLAGTIRQLTSLDWAVIAVYGVIAVSLGLYFARRAGQGTDAFFLSGRTLSWWLLGTSMVATTFSTDTPNLVTTLGPSWKGFATRPDAPVESLTPAFLGWFLGCAAVYSALFETGYLLYGQTLPGVICLMLFAAASWGLLRVLPRVGFSD